MTLEEALLAAATKGLTHLSLHPVFSEDRKTTYWRCTATPSTMHKYVSAQSLNPVEAVLEVLKALPKAPSRSKPVTAAVTHPMDLDRQAELERADRLDLPDSRKAALEPQPPKEGLDQWLPKA